MLSGTIKWGHNSRLNQYIDDGPSIVLLEPHNPIPVTGHISKFTFYSGRENETETYLQTYRRIRAMRFRIVTNAKVALKFSLCFYIQMVQVYVNDQRINHNMIKIPLRF